MSACGPSVGSEVMQANDAPGVFILGHCRRNFLPPWTKLFCALLLIMVMEINHFSSWLEVQPSSISGKRSEQLDFFELWQHRLSDSTKL